jgi:hypothetical protein
LLSVIAGVWWDYYKGAIEFKGERWTNSVSADALTKYGVSVVKTELKPGFSVEQDVIHRLGGNSGGQAVNLTLLRGASPVILLGFDMQATGGKKHWFGDHPGHLDRLQSFYDWVTAMDAAAESAAAPIINCSRVTALKSYPRTPLAQCLPASP